MVAVSGKFRHAVLVRPSTEKEEGRMLILLDILMDSFKRRLESQLMSFEIRAGEGGVALFIIICMPSREESQLPAAPWNPITRSQLHDIGLTRHLIAQLAHLYIP